MSLESMLHNIVDHLSVHPREKEALKAEITAEVGEKEAPENAPE
jgi:hypothetical protein